MTDQSETEYCCEAGREKWPANCPNHGETIAHVQHRRECCHGLDDVCVASGCLMGIVGGENG